MASGPFDLTGSRATTRTVTGSIGVSPGTRNKVSASTVSAIAAVISAAMAAGSVSSALASRAGMSSHPLGGGSRPDSTHSRKTQMSFSPNQNRGPLTPYNAAPRGLASDIARLLGCATSGLHCRGC
jgi:hypothetical protein